MAEATATKTTTPRRRAAAKPAAKAASKPAEAAPAESADDGITKVTFELANSGETKRYSTFDLSTDKDGNATGCVGKVYAPLGTETVKVLLAGPAEVVSPE